MNEKRNKFGELSTKEILEITDNAVPVTTNENIQRYVSVKFPVESCKILNINIEILRLHEDYVTTTIFT